MTRGLKKTVFKHFTLKPKPPNQKSDSYRCNYCTQSYVSHTTRMCEHLLECKGCPPCVKSVLQQKQDSKKKRSKKRKVTALDSTRESSSSSDSQNDSLQVPESPNGQKKQAKEPVKISNFLDKISKSEQEYCENLLAKALYTGGVSFRFLDNEYLLELFARLRPTFVCPSRDQMSGPLLDKIYNEVQADVDNKIENATTLTVQCDSYTTKTNEGLINFIINTPEPVFYKHLETNGASQTGEYLAEAVSDVIEEIGPKKTMALITDNASYCKKAWRLLEEKYEENQIHGYGCLAHGLNICCHDILTVNSAKSILEDATKIVKSIKQSNILWAALKEVQTLNARGTGEKKNKSLKLPGKTRWGSSLDCLKSTHENRYNLKQLSISEHCDRLSADVKRLILDDEFWQKVAKMITLLEPLVIWLKKVEGDESMMGETVNLFCDLENFFEKELLHTSLSIFSHQEAKHLLSQLLSRSKVFLTPLHFAANILNPKSRGKRLLPEIYSAGYEMILKIGRKFDKIPEEKLLTELVSYTAEEGFWRSDSIKKTAELVSPVAWWKGTCGCTALSKIAVAILNLPCSSAATERSFSTYGWIHSAKRNRFKVLRASKVTYIAHNLKLQNRHSKMKNKEYDYDSSDEDEELSEKEMDDLPVHGSDLFENADDFENGNGLDDLIRLPSSIQGLQEGTYVVETDSSLALTNK